MQRRKTLSLAAKIFICCLILIQLFPPLLVLDSTSLRHFLIALFDISALGFLINYTLKYKINPIKRQIFSSRLMIAWLTLLAFMGISMLWTINPVEGLAVWNRWIVVLLSAILACVFMLSENKTFKSLVICTIVIATINILSCIICYYVFDVHISQRNNLKLNGFYGNKNIFAVALLFKLPFLYYAFLRYKGLIKWYAFALIFFIAFCLVILSTRSCFIGLGMQLAVLTAYGLYSFAVKHKSKRELLRFALPIALAIAGFFAGNSFIEYNYNHYAKKNVKNNYSVEARFSSIAEGNSKGRLLIWKNTAEIIKQKPISGYGVGNHKLAIMKVECAKKHDYIVSDHAHNDFLEMFSELGVFGLLLYILTYLTAAIMTLKQLFDSRSNEIYRLRAMAGGGLILTYMNDAIFNFPLERADCQIYLAIGIAILISNHIKLSRMQTNEIKKPLFVSLIVLVVPVFLLETTHCYSSIMQKQRILQHNGNKSIGLSAKQWDRRTPKFPNIDESTHPRAVNIAERYASEKKYREAIDILLADKSNPYYSLRECRLASYYNNMDKADSAAYWAERCIAMKPLCYSPVRVLVSIEGKKQNSEAQLKLIDDYIARYKAEPLAWEDKITIQMRKKKYDEALETCDEALENLKRNHKISSLKDRICDILYKKMEK